MLPNPSGTPPNPTPTPTSPEPTELDAENSGTGQQDNILLPSVNPSHMDPQPGDSVVVSGVKSAHPVLLPAVPAKLRQHIIKVEYVEFDLLLSESMFPTRYNIKS